MSLVHAPTGSLTASVPIDQAAILRAFNINVNDPKAQAMILACEKYGLDPLLKHAILISGNLYVTRDGLLHVAHRSGLLDGIRIEDEGENPDEWWAKVTVYVKGQTHGYTYRGRYPKSGQQKKYGPEMAVKCAEVMALRRAFGVTGIATVEEQWDVADTVAQLAPAPIVDVLVSRMNALAPEDYRAQCKREYVATFGRPADLRVDDVADAEALVAKFEQEETDPTCAPSAHVSLLAEPTTPTASATGAGGENDQGAGQPADLAGKDPESLMGEAEDPLPAPEDAWAAVDKAAFDRWQRGARATANGALSANKDEYQAQWEALVYAASGGTQTSSKALTKDQCGWLKTRLMDLSSGKGRLVETDDAQYLGWKVDV